MSDEELAERCDELARDVLQPLVLGGRLTPVRPFGGPLSLAIGRGRTVRDPELSNRLDVARVRRARLLAPVDALAELDEGDWALLAALNDLLQLTNHNLGGALTRGRYGRILANLAWLLARIPAPRDVASALARHATFSRVLQVARTDASVSWWTGSAFFRGEPPPSRLLAWREVRRVHVSELHVPLVDMAVGVKGVSTTEFSDVLALWLTRSPLTDLATATRVSPSFAWSASTLALVSVPEGRALAYRALAQATARVPKAYEEAARVATRFQADLARTAEQTISR